MRHIRGLRAIGVVLTGLLAATPEAAAQSGSQTESVEGGQQLPTFRGGTDLLTLDVSVLDKGEHPVQGLRPADFTVEIDGQKRRVIAAEFVRANEEKTPSGPGAPGASAVAATGGGAAGRRIVIAVDQLYIPPGSITPLLNQAASFVDRLTSRDQAAFVAFPEPGPNVDFTSDKARLRQAMQGLVGQPPRFRRGEYDMGLAEALTINDKERSQTNSPVIDEIIERSCTASREKCEREIISQAVQMAEESTLDAKISLRTLESIIERLVPLDGTKSLVLISASLTIKDHRELDTLIHLAEAARVSLNVIVVDVPREGNRTSVKAPRPDRPDQSPAGSTDHRLLAEGLEELAADGRGGVYRLAGNAKGIFDRLAEKLSASYVLGVESRPEDLRSELRNVKVAVRRQGVKVRVSQAFVRSPAARVARSLEDMYREAVSSTTPLTELSVQIATFSQWDAASDSVRVSLAAAIGQPGIQPGDYVLGYVITDQENRKVIEWSEKQTLAVAGARRESKPFGASVLLEPGVYSLQMAIVDQGGRRGTALREVHVRRSTADDPATSDLIVGNPPRTGESLALNIEPHIGGGRVAAYLEIYSAMPADLDWTFVSFEIAQDPESPVLAEASAEMVEGRRPSWRVASGVVDASVLQPGRYVVRARIVRDGKTLRVMDRAFLLERAQERTLPSPL